MDRFIGSHQYRHRDTIRHLKSNMDRFIEPKKTTSVEFELSFKIQYG